MKIWNWKSLLLKTARNILAREATGTSWYLKRVYIAIFEPCHVIVWILPDL